MVLICLVAFFAVVTGVNAVMIRRRGVDLRRPRDRKARIRPASPSRAISRRRPRRTRYVGKSRRKSRPTSETTLVEVVAHDDADRPIAGLQATARLAHPADQRADRVIALRENAPGQFRGTKRVDGRPMGADRRAIARRGAPVSFQEPHLPALRRCHAGVARSLDLREAPRRSVAHGACGRRRRLRRLHPQDRGRPQADSRHRRCAPQLHQPAAGRGMAR